MLQLIERLQRKSEGERQAIAFWVAAGVTGVIALLWLVSVVTLRSAPTPESTASTDSSLPGADQFQNIGASAADFYEQFKQNVGELRSGLSGQAEVGTQPEASAPSVTDTEASAQNPSSAWAPDSPTWGTSETQ